MKQKLTMIGVTAIAVGTVLDAVATELITNGSFEELTGTVTENSGVWQAFTASFYCPGWTANGTGISTEKDTRTWKNRSAPKGNNVCIFGNEKSMTQTFTVDASSAGLCWVSFLYASRPSYPNTHIYVAIDGQVLGHVDCGSSTVFRHALMEAELAVGTHTLVISNSNAHIAGNTKGNAAIDAVSITPKRDLIFNGSFEEYTGTITKNSGVWQAFDEDFYCPGWTAGGTGISTETDTTVWKDRSAPDGTNACIFGANKSMTQTFTVDAASAGPCLVSLMYAVRNGYSGASFHVNIDGVEVGQVACGSTTAFRRSVMETNLSVGEHTLVIGNDSVNAVLDAVSITPKTALIVNGSFDLGTVDANSGTYSSAENDAGHSNPGWTVTGKSGLAKIGYPSDAMWASSELEGAGKYSMYLQTANYTYGGTDRQLPAVSVRQSFDVDKTGVYELRFSYAARPYNNYVGGQIFARVYSGDGVGGEMIWERFVIANSKTAFSEFVGTVKFYSTGRYSLEFYAPQLEYSTTAANEKDSVIDNVSLRFLRKIAGTIVSFY